MKWSEVKPSDRVLVLGTLQSARANVARTADLVMAGSSLSPEQRALAVLDIADAARAIIDAAVDHLESR